MSHLFYGNIQFEQFKEAFLPVCYFASGTEGRYSGNLQGAMHILEVVLIRGTKGWGTSCLEYLDRPMFYPLDLHKKLGMVSRVCDPGTGEAESGRPLT